MQIGNNFYYKEDGKYYCYSDFIHVEVGPELIASELVLWNCREKALIEGFEEVKTVLKWKWGGVTKCSQR